MMSGQTKNNLIHQIMRDEKDYSGVLNNGSNNDAPGLLEFVGKRVLAMIGCMLAVLILISGIQWMFGILPPILICELWKQLFG